MSSKTATKHEESDSELPDLVSDPSSVIGGFGNIVHKSSTSTLALICEAITVADEKRGSSVQAIKKYIHDKKEGGDVNSFFLKKAFTKGLKEGVLVREDKNESASLTGRYKLTKVQPSKVVKKPSAPKEVKAKENSSEQHTGKTKKSSKPATGSLSPVLEKAAKPSHKAESKPDSKKSETKKAAPKKVPVAKKNPGKKSKSEPKNKPEESKSDSETHDSKKVKSSRRRRSQSESEISVPVVAKPKRKLKASETAAKTGKKAPRV